MNNETNNNETLNRIETETNKLKTNHLLNQLVNKKNKTIETIKQNKIKELQKQKQNETVKEQKQNLKQFQQKQKEQNKIRNKWYNKTETETLNKKAIEYSNFLKQYEFLAYGFLPLQKQFNNKALTNKIDKYIYETALKNILPIETDKPYINTLNKISFLLATKDYQNKTKKQQQNLNEIRNLISSLNSFDYKMINQTFLFNLSNSFKKKSKKTLQNNLNVIMKPFKIIGFKFIQYVDKYKKVSYRLRDKFYVL